MKLSRSLAGTVLPLSSSGSSPAFQVNATDDRWRIDVPMPGIDPKDVTLDVAGNTLSNPAFIERDHLQTFDVVLANPPFGGNERKEV